MTAGTAPNNTNKTGGPVPPTNPGAAPSPAAPPAAQLAPNTSAAAVLAPNQKSTLPPPTGEEFAALQSTVGRMKKVLTGVGILAAVAAGAAFYAISKSNEAFKLAKEVATRPVADPNALKPGDFAKAIATTSVTAYWYNAAHQLQQCLVHLPQDTLLQVRDLRGVNVILTDIDGASEFVTSSRAVLQKIPPAGQTLSSMSVPVHCDKPADVRSVPLPEPQGYHIAPQRAPAAAPSSAAPHPAG